MNRDYERRRDLLLLHADSPPPWTPAAVPGCILYGGAYQEARATRGAQPTLVDGDMEAAGVAAWLDNASTVSKQGDPYAGLQCLRVTNAGGANRWAYQNVRGITGNRYRVTGAARGDGISSPKIALGGDSVEWGGTASNAWQVIASDYTFTSGPNLYLFTWGADGGYCEFDSLTLQQLSIQSYTPAYTTVAGSVLAQASATAQPWVSSDGLGVRYQGGDCMVWSAAASAVKCLHDGSGGTLIVAVRFSALNAINGVAATAPDADPSEVGFGLWTTNANQIRVSFAKGGGGADYDSLDTACPIAINTTYVFTLRSVAGANGVSVRVNGVNKITGALTAPSAADPTNSLTIGGLKAGSAYYTDGVLGHPFVANRVLSDAECTQIENYILAQATL